MCLHRRVHLGCAPARQALFILTGGSATARRCKGPLCGSLLCRSRAKVGKAGPKGQGYPVIPSLLHHHDLFCLPWCRLPRESWVRALPVAWQGVWLRHAHLRGAVGHCTARGCSTARRALSQLRMYVCVCVPLCRCARAACRVGTTDRPRLIALIVAAFLGWGAERGEGEGRTKAWGPQRSSARRNHATCFFGRGALAAALTVPAWRVRVA